MNCDTYKPMLVELLYNEVTDEDRHRVEKHLGECTACREEWDALHKSHQALNLVSESVRESHVQVRHICDSIVQRANWSQRRWKRAAIASGLVAATLLVVAGLRFRMEFHPTHMIIGWGNVPQTVKIEPASIVLQPDLSEQNLRLEGLEQLVRLTAHELLETDRRRSAELMNLNSQLQHLRQQSAAKFDHMQVQSDLRWRLLLDELSLKPTSDMLAGTNSTQLEQ